MRSRYTAFSEGHASYLLDTHLGAPDGAQARADLSRSCADTVWLNLIVIATQKGGPEDQTGLVDFAAAWRPRAAALHSDPAAIVQMHERSRFLRQDGHWFYVDGDQLPPYQTRRNEPCWCGSGRKTKQCHG